MKRIIGGILLFVGLMVMLVGLAGALQGYVHILQEAVNNPLAEGATTDEPERAQAASMLRWAIIGFVGVPIAAVGALLSLSARIQRMKAKRLSRGG